MGCSVKLGFCAMTDPFFFLERWHPRMSELGDLRDLPTDHSHAILDHTDKDQKVEVSCLLTLQPPQVGGDRDGFRAALS